jgi:hypothetical protein
MRKSIVVLAMLAAATSVAVAKDLNQDKKAEVPAVAAKQMTDADMDKVTAGDGFGLSTACCASSNVLDHLQSDLGRRGVDPGYGQITAPGRP